MQGKLAALKAEKESIISEGQRLRTEMEEELKKEIGRTSSLYTEMRRVENSQVCWQLAAPSTSSIKRRSDRE